MTYIWPFKVTKGQTDNAIRFATHDFLPVFYGNYNAILHGNPVFLQTTLIWPFKVTRGQTDYAILFAIHNLLLVSIILNIALSRTETLFFSRWPRSGLSRSPKVKLIMPFDSWHIISYPCSKVTIALSRTKTLFFSRWPWSGLSRSPTVKLTTPSDPRCFSADDLDLAFRGHQRSNWLCHSIHDISFPIRVLK